MASAHCAIWVVTSTSAMIDDASPDGLDFVRLKIGDGTDITEIEVIAREEPEEIAHGPEIEFLQKFSAARPCPFDELQRGLEGRFAFRRLAPGHASDRMSWRPKSISSRHSVLEPVS